MTLSDDPHVSQIKSNIIKAAHMFGYSEIDSMEKFFNKLDKTIERLEQSLDRWWVFPYNKSVVIQRILIYPN